jgi:hypothetical protein
VKGSGGLEWQIERACAGEKVVRGLACPSFVRNADAHSSSSGRALCKPLKIRTASRTIFGPNTTKSRQIVVTTMTEKTTSTCGFRSAKYFTTKRRATRQTITMVNVMDPKKSALPLPFCCAGSGVRGSCPPTYSGACPRSPICGGEGDRSRDSKDTLLKESVFAVGFDSLVPHDSSVETGIVRRKSG